MGSPSDNVAKLKNAYGQWHDSKGGSVKAWLDFMADDVRVYSLAAGAPEAEFTAAVTSKKDFGRYFDGLLADWEMINYDGLAESEDRSDRRHAQGRLLDVQQWEGRGVPRVLRHGGAHRRREGLAPPWPS